MYDHDTQVDSMPSNGMNGDRVNGRHSVEMTL